MPINLSIEYPKLQNEVTKLRYQNKELLEALQDFCNLRTAYSDNDFTKAYHKAKAAIQKAEGKDTFGTYSKEAKDIIK